MSNRIRLLILTDSVGAASGEAPPAALRLARLCDPSLFICRIVTLFSTSEPETVTETPYAIRSLNLPRGLLRWNPAARHAIGRELRRFRPHCLCVAGTQARIVGPVVARRSGVTSQAVVIEDMGFATPPGLLPVLRAANRQADHVVTTSYASARRLVRQENIDRSLIDIIPLGIDGTGFPRRTAASVTEAKHRMGLSVHQPVILMAADLVRHKDHITFLEAAAHLQPLVPNARFVILGNGARTARARLENTIAQLGLSGRVTMTGDWSALPAWMNAADVGVLTSYGESCSPTLLSYMAAQLPIAAADVGGNRELIRHNESGYLVAPCEADQLAVFLMVLLLSPDLAERFGRAARRRIERDFSAEQEARRWSDYFRTLAMASA